MAKTELNPILRQVRGTLGGVTFRRMHGKQTLIKKPDMSRVQWSAAQQAHRQRFKEAVAYARAALADASVRAQYEAESAQAGKRPFDLAVSDYFKGRNLLEE